MHIIRSQLHDIMLICSYWMTYAHMLIHCVCLRSHFVTYWSTVGRPVDNLCIPTPTQKLKVVDVSWLVKIQAVSTPWAFTFPTPASFWPLLADLLNNYTSCPVYALADYSLAVTWTLYNVCVANHMNFSDLAPFRPQVSDQTNVEFLR
jgi:hypothetical protein